MQILASFIAIFAYTMVYNYGKIVTSKGTKIKERGNNMNAYDYLKEKQYSGDSAKYIVKIGDVIIAYGTAKELTRVLSFEILNAGRWNIYDYVLVKI